MSEFNKYSTDGGATFIDVEDSEAVHYGEQSKGYVGKNLFKNTGLSTTSNNVAFTHNSDDSIGLNNTASATTFYTIGSVASLAGINQNVILSGCPVGGDTNNGYSMGIRTTSNKNVRHDNIDIVDTGNGFIFNPSNPLKDSDGNSVSISDLVLVMRIGNGVNVSDKTFYPMIRLATIPDITYEPYIHPNTEIPEKMTYVDNAVYGVHNLIPFPYIGGNSNSDKGVDFVVNDDGSVVLNNTATGDARYYFVNTDQAYNPFEKYGVDSICLENNGYNTNNVWIEFAFYNGTTYAGVVERTKFSNRIIINKPSITFDRITIYILVSKDQSCSDFVVKPVLCMSDDICDKFQKPTLTNRDLTDRVMQSVENVTATFKDEVVISGSRITNVEWARKYRYGNILIFEARVNKAANTDIWTTIQCPLTFPEKFISDIIFTFNSPKGGGTGTFGKNDKGVTFRYGLADDTTYIDMHMIAIVSV